MWLPKCSGTGPVDGGVQGRGGCWATRATFQAWRRGGGLSPRARALQLSQPGLTAVIKQLEESFGTKLLVRLRTGVSLTSTGEELLRYANESLVRLEELEQRIKGLESDEA